MRWESKDTSSSIDRALIGWSIGRIWLIVNRICISQRGTGSVQFCVAHRMGRLFSHFCVWIEKKPRKGVKGVCRGRRRMRMTWNWSVIGHTHTINCCAAGVCQIRKFYTIFSAGTVWIGAGVGKLLIKKPPDGLQWNGNGKELTIHDLLRSFN